MKIIYQEKIGGILITSLVSPYEACAKYAYSDCSEASFEGCFIPDEEKAGHFIPCEIKREGSYTEDDGNTYVIMEILPEGEITGLYYHVKSH